MNFGFGSKTVSPAAPASPVVLSPAVQNRKGSKSKDPDQSRSITSLLNAQLSGSGSGKSDKEKNGRGPVTKKSVILLNGAVIQNVNTEKKEQQTQKELQAKETSIQRVKDNAAAIKAETNQPDQVMNKLKLLNQILFIASIQILSIVFCPLFFSENNSIY